MVLRVLVVLFCVSLSLSTLLPSAVAGGPPMAPPPSYSCAPPVCSGPACGPVPFGFCSGILGLCSRICGTVLGCPAAVAGAILNTPPPIFPRRRCFTRRCGPVMCAPRCFPVPVCAPAPCPPPPRRIAKVRPVASAPAPAYGASFGPVVQPASYQPGPVGFAPGYSAAAMSGGGNFGGELMSMPFRLSAGVLGVPEETYGPLADIFGAVTELFDE